MSPSSKKGFGSDDKPKPEILKVQKACDARPSSTGASLFGRIRHSETTEIKAAPERLEERALTQQELARREQRLPLIEQGMRKYGYTLEGFRATAFTFVPYDEGPASAYDLLHKPEAELHVKLQFLSAALVDMRKESEALRDRKEKTEDPERFESITRGLDGLHSKIRIYQLHYFLIKTIVAASREALAEYIELSRSRLDAYGKLHAEHRALKSQNQALRAQLSEFLNPEGIELPDPELSEVIKPEATAARPVEFLYAEMERYGAEHCAKQWNGFDMHAFIDALKEETAWRYEAWVEKQEEEARAREARVEELYDALGDAAHIGITFPD